METNRKSFTREYAKSLALQRFHIVVRCKGKQHDFNPLPCEIRMFDEFTLLLNFPLPDKSGTVNLWWVCPRSRMRNCDTETIEKI